MENKTEIKMKCKKEVMNKIFTRAKPFVNEIALKITKKGIDGCVVDNAHVALYECKIGKKNFELYELSEEKTIGIDLTKIDIPLSLVKEDMEMEYLEYESKLRINNYKHSLIDITGMPNARIPTINHPIEIKTDKAEMLKKLVSVAAKISDTVEFYTGEDKKLWIRAKGDTDEFAEPIGEVTEIRETKYPVSSKFSVDVLSNVFKDLKEELTISISKDEPIKIIEEKEEERHLFMVAPRVETE